MSDQLMIILINVICMLSIILTIAIFLAKII